MRKRRKAFLAMGIRLRLDTTSKVKMLQRAPLSYSIAVRTLYMCHIHPTSSSYPFRGIVQRPDGVLQLDSFCYIICRQWTFRYGRRHGGLEEIHWTVVLADVMIFAQDKNALLSLVAAWRVIMTGRTPPKGSATPRAKIAYLS